MSLVLTPTKGRAVPPPHRRHVFAGAISPDPGRDRPGRMKLRVDCILYSSVDEGDDFCSGRYTCAGAACPVRSGVTELQLLPSEFDERRTDPSRPATLGLLNASGGCTVVGSVAYALTSAIPAFAGRYECVAEDGSPLGGGLFGMRAIKVSKRYYDLR